MGIGPLSVALIGAGGIAPAHLAALKADPRARIVGIVDEDLARAESRAQEAGHGVAAYTDLQALLKEKPPKALVISTPPASHLEVIRAGLRARMAILCEKPLAHTLPEARKIVQVVHRSDGLFVMGFCHRFVDGIRRLKQLLDSGELGRPLLFRSHFSARIEGIEATWFSHRELSGGGVLMDTAILSIDLFRYLIGEIRSAVARSVSNLKGLQVEDTGIMIVESREGCLGCIEASWMPPIGAKILEIRGTEGTAIWDYNVLRWKCANDESWTEEKLGKPYQTRFDAQMRHFLTVAEGKAKPLVTVEDGIRAMEMALSVYREIQKPGHKKSR
jgi:predicted dehydrogenase